MKRFKLVLKIVGGILSLFIIILLITEMEDIIYLKGNYFKLKCSSIYDSGNDAFNEGNYHKAVKNYKLAQMFDNAPYLKFNIALCYENMDDYDKAFKWYEKAAKKDFAAAQFNLAIMYYNGTGVEPDLQQSFYWAKKAAEQNFVPAQNLLGSLYYDGEGVETDISQALHWWTLAADNGSSSAMIYLGKYYYENKKYKDAKRWLNQALNSNDISGDMRTYASELLDDVKRAESTGLFEALTGLMLLGL